MRYTMSILAICLSCFTISGLSEEIQTGGEICGQPENPCTSDSFDFQPNDLSFQLPEKLTWQSNHYSSHFYAVILRSVKAVQTQHADSDSDIVCKATIPESERLQVQTQFPSHKVFTSRNGCFSAVRYTNVNDKYDFIAVYAGDNATDAKKILAQAKAAGFRDANLRKMQVVADNGD